MRKSEIFDSFVKIAQEKGMISNDSSESKKKLEQTGRAGSDDISTIEALYGVKPESDVDYKFNIMEAAHPNSVVVSPSYDKLNGLVENNIERQNILINIVNKPVNGHSTQAKYAETELLMTLVRVGNELDNHNADELRVLSDVCLAQISKPLNKKAWVLPVAAGVVAILGGIYLKNHMRFISDGLERDHQKLIAEIDDLLTSNADWGVGYQYKQSFTQMLQDFRGKLENFYKIFKTIEPIIEEIEQPRDAKELMAKAKEADTGKIQKAIDAFRASADNLLPEIQKIIKNFGNEAYKQRQTEDKGWMSSLIDATQVLHGGKGLIADDFDDVKHALETYLMDISNVKKTLADVGTVQQQANRELADASAKSNELFGANQPASAPAAAPAQGKTVEDLDKESANLEKDLSSLFG